MTTLVWFRNDLRVRDHRALAQAQDQGDAVAVYIHEDTGTPLGGACQWWLHHSLHAHAKKLAELGIPFLIERGDPLDIIPALATKLGADAVTWQRRYDAPGIEVDTKLKALLPTVNIHPTSHPGSLLLEPWEISTSTGGPYRVYSPFAKAAKRLIGDADLVAAPRTQSGLTALDPSASIDNLGLLPEHRGEPDWSGGLDIEWTPGECGADDRLSDFLDELERGADYSEGRDFPARHATSRLSPHLRFGEISPRQAWDACTDSVFRSELLWREFAWHRFYHLPDLATVNVRSEFDNYDWSYNDPAAADSLHHWRNGTTGIPLVDAGMRELRETGYMHNRVRMVVGSFLTKNLGIHWRHGEEWFWDNLVDADLASNAFNWQWVAGSGDDASPFFRIFNPETQAKKFDPDGIYIKRWNTDSARQLDPTPIVDLKESRQAALDAYQAIKG